MKAAARRILMDIPEYAKSDRELWTPPLVKKALVDAYRMLRRVGGHYGPARVKAAWPEYADAGDYPPERPKTSPYATAMTVTRMEMVVCGWHDDNGDHPPWLAGPLLEHQRYRTMLVTWIENELAGSNFTLLCEHRRWPLATAKRHRDRAAAMIADRLNRAGVETW